jgi:hypothetical protein
MDPEAVAQASVPGSVIWRPVGDKNLGHPPMKIFSLIEMKTRIDAFLPDVTDRVIGSFTSSK